MGRLADYHWLRSRRSARRRAPGTAHQTLRLTNHRGGLPGRQWLASPRGRGPAQARGGENDLLKRQRARGQIPATRLADLERGYRGRLLSGARADSWHLALRRYDGWRPGCTPLPRGRGSLLVLVRHAAHLRGRRAGGSAIDRAERLNLDADHHRGSTFGGCSFPEYEVSHQIL